MTKFDDDIDSFVQKTKEFTNLKRLDQRKVKTIAASFLGKIKEEIARGLSPITRKKFPKYKNPEKYPGKRKPHRPVNLELTGAMLKDLKLQALITAKDYIQIVLKYSTPSSVAKERGHREGANSQPKRPTLPQGEENFSRFLIKELEGFYAKLVEKFDV